MNNNTPRRSIGLGKSCAGICIIVWLAFAWTRAQAGAMEPIRVANAENTALRQVIDARLAREQWHLEQVVSLRNEGHASWLEVARQQMIVDTLKSRHMATRSFSTLLETLRDRVAQSPRSARGTDHDDSIYELPPIKLSLPGSWRLVGWLEANQVVPELRSRYVAMLRKTLETVGSAESHIDLAAENVTRCTESVRRLAQVTGNEKARIDLRRARLDLAVAKSELALSRVDSQRYQREREQFERLQNSLNDRTQLWEVEGPAEPAVRQEPHPPFPRIALGHLETARASVTNRENNPSGEPDVYETAEMTYITHLTSPALHSATLRVAAAEAQSRGELQAVNISLQRLNLHCDALEQLQSEGYANKYEVESVREKRTAAESLLSELQAQRSNLQNSYQALRRLTDEPRVTTVAYRDSRAQALISMDGGTGALEIGTLPRACFANKAVVRHLIDLGRKHCETESGRAAVLSELNLLESLFAKLSRAEQRWADNQRQPDNSKSTEEFQGVLAAGRRREREYVRLDVAAAQARLLATDERLMVIRLEAIRFARQISHQFSHLEEFDRSGVSSASVWLKQRESLPGAEGLFSLISTSTDWAHSHPVALAWAGFGRAGHVCYLESPDTLGHAIACEFTPSSWDRAMKATTSPSILHRIQRSIRDVTMSRMRYHLGGVSSYAFRCSPLRLRLCVCQPAHPFSWQPADRLYSLRTGCERIGDALSGSTTRRKFRVPTYSEYYAFGTRRTDFQAPSLKHGLVTPYGGPWYFPGASTNLPYGGPWSYPGESTNSR